MEVFDLKRTISVLFLLLALVSSCASAQSAMETALTPHTTQAFTEEAISKDDLTAIAQAGLSTASAINQQPWYFSIVTNKAIMAEVSASGGMPAGMKPEGAPSDGAMPAGAPPAASGSATAKAALGDSPAAIFIYMNESTMSPDPNFDCGMACQSMVVKARALGYGAKVVSAPTMALNGENHDALCEALGVDPALKAVAVVLIGKEDTDAASSASTRQPLEEKVSFIE